MTATASILVALVTVGGALTWIGLLLWGARGDGRDQQRYDEAVDRYRRDEDERRG